MGNPVIDAVANMAQNINLENRDLNLIQPPKQSTRTPAACGETLAGQLLDGRRAGRKDRNVRTVIRGGTTRLPCERYYDQDADAEPKRRQNGRGGATKPRRQQRKKQHCETKARKQLPGIKENHHLLIVYSTDVVRGARQILRPNKRWRLGGCEQLTTGSLSIWALAAHPAPRRLCAVPAHKTPRLQP